MRLRRRTRETYRHELAVVRQELGTPSAAAVRADIAANQARAAELRRGVRRGGGSHASQLGLVTSRPGAGGTAADPCKYCLTIGGHTADCPVIS